jgi:hypothetical protein
MTMAKKTETTKPGEVPLTNARHELFAQGAASGMTKSEAYIEAYPNAAKYAPTTLYPKASVLAARQDVSERIRHLTERAADAAVFTLAEHLRRLNALSKAAQKAGEFTAAVKAEENRGKAAGFYPTKVELTGRGGGPIETKQTRDLTDSELRAELEKHGIQP